MATHPLATLDSVIDMVRELPPERETARRAAMARSDRLTKPQGSLGELERIAAWHAAWSRNERHSPTERKIIVFAGNHGVAARGVSAFPGSVTEQMVRNFRHGGAAINQLADAAGARLEIVELALACPTADFTTGAAMSDDEFLSALQAGWDAVAASDELVAIGEMGIGNTCSAAALCGVLFGGDARRWTGAGTGVDGTALATKIAVVEEAINLHGDQVIGPLDAVRRVGGREMAAMIGAILRTRHNPTPLILDGFVCCAAAAALHCANPASLDHTMAGHLSAEAAHGRLLARIAKTPLLTLSMRLGEASGAAVAMSIVNCALACHFRMATFEEASVATHRQA